MHLELLVRLLERLAVLLRAPLVAVGPKVSTRLLREEQQRPTRRLGGQRRLELEAVVREPVDEKIVHFVVLEPAAGGDPRRVPFNNSDLDQTANSDNCIFNLMQTIKDT